MYFEIIAPLKLKRAQQTTATTRQNLLFHEAAQLPLAEPKNKFYVFSIPVGQYWTSTERRDRESTYYDQPIRFYSWRHKSSMSGITQTASRASTDIR